VQADLVPDVAVQADPILWMLPCNLI
jgi:hypothetical protein